MFRVKIWNWSIIFLSSFLFNEDYEEKCEDNRDIYRAGMAAFEGIVPEYHIELRERPTMVWDFLFPDVGNPDDVQLHAGG